MTSPSREIQLNCKRLSYDRRPAFEWLESLQTHQVSCFGAQCPVPMLLSIEMEGRGKEQGKRTIADIVEKLNGGVISEECIPSSPRSVEACFRLGIDPFDLVARPREIFNVHGEDEEISEYRYEQCENIRQDLIKQLLQERQNLVNSPSKTSRPHQSNGGSGGSELVEKERQRLEVLKRRQERELQQMLSHEEQRKEMISKQQAKIEAAEKRAATLQKLKAEKDAQWRQQQRDRELNRQKERAALELVAKKEDQKRFDEEMEQQEIEKKEAIKRKQQALEEEKKLREKAERSRQENQRILEEQQEAVRRRRQEMEKRDAERQKRVKEEQELKSLANQQKRQLAQERLEAAMDKDRELQLQKQLQFQRREELGRQRRDALAATRKMAEEQRKENEKQKEQYRKGKYELSIAHERQRIQGIKDKVKHKDSVLEEMAQRQQKANAHAAVERELHAFMKKEKAARTHKIRIYHRHMLFQKIMSDRARTGKQLDAKAALQQQRRMANMQASMERQRLKALMEKMKRKHQNVSV